MTKYLPKTFTLHIETVEGRDGIWLCLDDGMDKLPLARFTDDDTTEAIDLYNRAISIMTMKAHAMGKSGI